MDNAEPIMWVVMGSVVLIIAIACAMWQDKERKYLMDKIVKQRAEIELLRKATISVFWRDDGVTALRLDNDLLVDSKQYGRVVIPRGFISDGHTIPRGSWFSNHSDKQWTLGCILSDYLDDSKEKKETTNDGIQSRPNQSPEALCRHDRQGGVHRHRPTPALQPGLCVQVRLAGRRERPRHP